MCRGERVDDLASHGEHILERERADRKAIGQRVARHELQDERDRVGRFFQPVDSGDVRVVQSREDFGFAAEAGHAVGVVGDGIRQDLDGDVPLEFDVPGAVHLAHAAGADGGHDLVGAKAGSGR